MGPSRGRRTSLYQKDASLEELEAILLCETRGTLELAMRAQGHAKGQKEIQDAPEKHSSLFPHLEQLAVSLTSPFTATEQYLK